MSIQHHPTRAPASNLAPSILSYIYLYYQAASRRPSRTAFSPRSWSLEMPLRPWLCITSTHLAISYCSLRSVTPSPHVTFAVRFLYSLDFTGHLDHIEIRGLLRCSARALSGVELKISRFANLGHHNFEDYLKFGLTESWFYSFCDCPKSKEAKYWSLAAFSCTCVPIVYMAPRPRTRWPMFCGTTQNLFITFVLFVWCTEYLQLSSH
jgi:hypothetical protein